MTATITKNLLTSDKDMSEQLTTQSICYDNTRLSDYKNCPRSYFIRHILGWRIEGTADALVFGLSWHEGQDIIWKHAKQVDKHTLTQLAFGAFCDKWQEGGFPLDMDFGGYDRFGARTPGTAKEMIWNYIGERETVLKECTVRSIEQPFAVPLPGLPDHWYVGRLDKAIEWGPNKLIIEHKTTTAYATQGNFRTDYIESWYASSQVKGYEFAGTLYYPDLTGVWVDAALVHKKVHDAFRFVPVSHNTTLLLEWLENTNKWATTVTTATRMLEAGEPLAQCFPKNEEHCFGKFGQCPYLDICRSIADPRQMHDVPGGYVEEKWEPFSILKLDQLVKESQQTEVQS